MPVSEAEKTQWAGLASHMRVLVGQQAWDVFQQEWSLRETDAIRALIADGKERYDYNKGFLDGLKAAIRIPAERIEQYERMR